MSRLIDADKLKKPIYAEDDNCTGDGMTYDEMDAYNAGINIAWSRIESAPTVDAVPVVRCGECAYSREPNRHDLAEKKACAGILVCCVGFDHVYPSSDDGLIFVDKDHFCADGERKVDKN